jgi:predicted GNAT family acetyltransferase
MKDGPADRARERALDEALDETFPASDPPANTVETGIRVGQREPVDSVVDNRDAQQFELSIGDQTAFLAYERTPRSLIFVHTEVPPALRGHHLGDKLIEAAISAAHAEGKGIVAVCPFVKAYLRKHPHVDATAASDKQ